MDKPANATAINLFDPINGTAEISDCGRYRYRLTRGTKPFVSWLMLNPSTADAREDDPTIRRCVRFAMDWGYKGIYVVNIYPYRTSSPAECRMMDEYGGVDDALAIGFNLPYISDASAASALRMVAFGANVWSDSMVSHVIRRYAQGGTSRRPLFCLGTTQRGWPVHPMARGRHRVPSDRIPQPWWLPGLGE